MGTKGTYVSSKVERSQDMYARERELGKRDWTHPSSQRRDLLCEGGLSELDVEGGGTALNEGVEGLGRHRSERSEEKGG